MSIMNRRYYYHENPNNGYEMRINLDDIDELAADDGVDIRAEEMDQDMFERYVDELLYRRGLI